MGGYALLMGSFAGLCAGFAGWLRTSERELPERVETRDLVLISIATHKASRLIAKDRVTSTVRVLPRVLDARSCSSSLVGGR